MSTITPLPDASDARQVVAAEVRALMGRYEVNQTQAALLLGISQSQMSKRLRGIVPFDIDEVAVLAHHFNVSVGSLFGETNANPHPAGPDGGNGADDQIRTGNILLGRQRLYETVLRPNFGTPSPIAA